jgi:hypothetical protein
MSTEEPPPPADDVIRYRLDGDDPGDDDLPRRSYWWSLHRPETYAVTALALAFVTLMSLAPAQELAQAVQVHSPNGPFDEKTLLLVVSSVRLGMAVLSIVCAGIAVRSEDDDVTWSAPLARAAILVAVVSALVSIASLITEITAGSPDQNGVLGP